MVRHTTADGRRLAWQVHGTGPALVLINGYAASSGDWDPRFLGLLSARFRVICPDNRGIGNSDLGDPGVLTVEAMAADVVAVLDALELDQVPLVGWSMGGFVAQWVALAKPSRVSALVLLATDPGGPSAELAAPGTWARLTDHTGTAREQASRLLGLLFPPGVAADIDRLFGADVARARASLSVRTLIGQEAAIERWHALDPPRPSSAAPPVLAVCGSDDIVIPARNSQLLAERWSDCQIESIAGGGHALMAQAPERVAALIGSFVG